MTNNSSSSLEKWYDEPRVLFPMMMTVFQSLFIGCYLFYWIGNFGFDLSGRNLQYWQFMLIPIIMPIATALWTWKSCSEFKKQSGDNVV